MKIVRSEFKCIVYQRSLVSYEDRKSTRLNSSHLVISYAVFCLKKKKKHLTDRDVLQFVEPFHRVDIVTADVLAEYNAHHPIMVCHRRVTDYPAVVSYGS